MKNLIQEVVILTNGKMINGDREWQGILPIRKWNEGSIWLYTLLKEI